MTEALLVLILLAIVYYGTALLRGLAKVLGEGNALYAFRWRHEKKDPPRLL